MGNPDFGLTANLVLRVNIAALNKPKKEKVDVVARFVLTGHSSSLVSSSEGREKDTPI